MPQAVKRIRRFNLSAVVLAMSLTACHVPGGHEQAPTIEVPPSVFLKKGDAVLVVGAIRERIGERDAPMGEGGGLRIHPSAAPAECGRACQPKHGRSPTAPVGGRKGSTWQRR